MLRASHAPLGKSAQKSKLAIYGSSGLAVHRRTLTQGVAFVCGQRKFLVKPLLGYRHDKLNPSIDVLITTHTTVLALYMPFTTQRGRGRTLGTAHSCQGTKALRWVAVALYATQPCSAELLGRSARPSTLADMPLAGA